MVDDIFPSRLQDPKRVSSISSDRFRIGLGGASISSDANFSRICRSIQDPTNPVSEIS